jgi:site-specific DNA-methyltransferase (adenine-specific)
VFYQKLPTYNPQWWYSEPYKAENRKRGKTSEWLCSKTGGAQGGSIRDFVITAGSEDGHRYPTSIICFPNGERKLHPSQKPVALLEYLIKTYTNEEEVVLDNCFGSGSTLVAAANTNRHYIGFELEPKFVDIARERLEKLKKVA